MTPPRRGLIYCCAEDIAAPLKALTDVISDGDWALRYWTVDGAAAVAELLGHLPISCTTGSDQLSSDRHVEGEQIHLPTCEPCGR